MGYATLGVYVGLRCEPCPYGSRWSATRLRALFRPVSSGDTRERLSMCTVTSLCNEYVTPTVCTTDIDFVTVILLSLYTDFNAPGRVLSHVSTSLSESTSFSSRICSFSRHAGGSAGMLMHLSKTHHTSVSYTHLTLPTILLV